MERTFTVSDSEIDVKGGRYTGKSPYAVAAKAARVLFKQAKATKREIRFTLKETTRDSSEKTFRYIGVKEQLNKPIVVTLGNSEVSINHKYHVKSCRA